VYIRRRLERQVSKDQKRFWIRWNGRGLSPRFLHKVERLSPSSLPKFQSRSGPDARHQVDLVLGEVEAVVADEIACETERAADLAHMRTRAVEREIAETREMWEGQRWV
jgi:hypothetical protein